LKEPEDIKEPLAERILGRVSLQDIVDPISKEVDCGAAVNLSMKILRSKLLKHRLKTVIIRSVLTC